MPTNMRSEHVDRFNHDEDAAGYDREVRDESDPIRTGYEAVLDWVAERASIGPGSRVLELGSGTGNLTLRLPAAAEIVCVDVSSAMIDIAREKLAGRGDVRWIEADLFEAVSPLLEECERFDRIVSTYALHHLTDEEKTLYFECLAELLADDGRAVFGDLMFEDRVERRRLLASYREQGERELVETIEDEFFWDLETARPTLERLGFTVEVERFSELSWGVLATRGSGTAGRS